MEQINRLNDYYKRTFGSKVYKLSLNGGMTCPNRDGTIDNAHFEPNVPGVQIINRLRNANKDNVVPLLEYANPAIVLTGTARRLFLLEEEQINSHNC